MNPRTRICTKCGEAKTLDEFYLHDRHKDGRMRRCKACVLTEQRERRRKNPTKHRESSREWQAAHPKEFKAYQDAYRLRTREEQNEHRRRLRQDDPHHRARYNANTAVYYAVRIGRLQRPDRCELCGTIGRVQGHHHKGYAKKHRLDVIWLCLPCHALAEL